MEKSVNKALVLKFTGSISENTFPEYKKEAIDFVKKADFPIVSSEDFSTAVANVKECKEVEEAITTAKEKAFSEMEEISNTLDDLGVVFSTVRTFRLKRSKDITTETERKRDAMIAAGFKLISESFDVLQKEQPLILEVVAVNDSPVRLATKGKRTEESGGKAIALVVASEIERIKEAVVLVTENEKNIDGCGYPDLFPDKTGIIGRPVAEIKLLVESRVSKHKLSEKERKDRAEAAAKEAAEAKAKREADAKAKEEAAKVEVEHEVKTNTTYTPEKETVIPSQVETPAYATTKVEQPAANNQEGLFVLSVNIIGLPDEAKEIARKVDSALLNEPKAMSISLSRAK